MRLFSLVCSLLLGAPAFAAGVPAPAEPGVNTPFVKVDSVGYLPDQPKTAVVNVAAQLLRSPEEAAAKGGVVFSIVDLDARKVVWYAHDGMHYKGKDAASGDEAWEVDFSGLTLSGHYAASLAMVCGRSQDCAPTPEFDAWARSAPFDISPTVYARALIAAQKMFYFQRSRIQLKEPYTLWDADDDGYARTGVPHQHEDVGWLLDDYPAKKTRWPVKKGWFDAGNEDMYIPSTAPAAQELLLAYELMPRAFGDANGIPESGNKIPDVLDEAAWGLDWILSMQTPEGAFRAREAVMRLGEVNEGPAEADRTARWVSGIASPSTAKACSVLAMASRIFRPFDDERSQAYGKAAMRAWAWLQAHPQRLALSVPKESDQPLWDDGPEYPREAGARAAAAFEVWRSFRDKGALKALQALWQDEQLQAQGLEGGWTNIGRFAVLGVMMDEGSPAAMREEARQRLFQQVDPLKAVVDADGYRCALKKDEYYWGSPCVLMEKAALLALAAHQDPPGHAWALDAARDQWHWVLGCNPNGYSLVSRVGHGPTRIYHTEWGKKRSPPPGYLVDGPNYNSAPFLAPGLPAKALLWYSPVDLASGVKAGDPWHNDQRDLWDGGFVPHDQWSTGWWVVSEVDLSYNSSLVLAGALITTP